MAAHSLSLEAPDTMNSCVLRVVDTSSYMTGVTVKCPWLYITLPGFTQPVIFTENTTPAITPGFIFNFTACQLGIQTVNCGTSFSNLSDGIYILKYSVSPNDQVFVEYNHLRITCALKTYQAILCEIDLGTCDPPASVKAKLEKLRLAKMYLDAAKAQVEVCHHPDKGMELYKYAVKLLNKLSCSTSCSTC